MWKTNVLANDTTVFDVIPAAQAPIGFNNPTI